jgi:hypothetical protein
VRRRWRRRVRESIFGAWGAELELVGMGRLWVMCFEKLLVLSLMGVSVVLGPERLWAEVHVSQCPEASISSSVGRLLRRHC